MTDLNLVHVVLHDRDEPGELKKDGTLTINYKDAVAAIKGKTIGAITVDFSGWMPKDLEVALAAATATVREMILQEIMKRELFKQWVGQEDHLRVGMANRCIYIFVTKPDDSRINLLPGDFPAFCEAVNESQNWFEIRDGRISFGSPQGGTLQFMYKLKD